MTERDFQTKFGKWLKGNFNRPAAFELKVCDTSLPFSAVKEHQIQGLLHVKQGSIYMKLPDIGLQMPFDCFVLSGEAYVVVRYSSGNWYAIDIDVFIKASKAMERRSLLEGNARGLSTFSSLTERS